MSNLSIDFLDIPFTNVDLSAVTEQLRRSTSESAYFYIVTPNVDHVVRIAAELRNGGSSELLRCYRQAKLCLCDSRILKMLARTKGIVLRVICGSDLTVHVLNEVAKSGDIIAVVGGDVLMLDALQRRYPLLMFRHHAPPMGMRHNPRAIAAAADFVVGCGARFSFLAVGSPQQELLAAKIGQDARARGVAFCIGASLDFIVGREKRAPRFVQRMGLEWTYRLIQNPKRLWRRYLIEGPRIFLLVATWRAGSRATK